MLQSEKIKRTELLKEKLEGKENVFLLSFKGVNVPDITRIRSELKESDAEYIVVKNRLFKRIIEEGGLTDLTELLNGPTAIVIAKGDPVEPSKKIIAFSKDHPDFIFKGGCVEGKIVDAATLVELSKMPSKDELIAKLLFMLQSPMRRLVTALNTPVQNTVSVLSQISKEK